MITTFEESMLLWLAVNSESESESDEELRLVTASNGAVLDFCDGLISLDDMFQAIEYYGADIDNYIEDLVETVNVFGV